MGLGTVGVVGVELDDVALALAAALAAPVRHVRPGRFRQAGTQKGSAARPADRQGGRR